MLVSVQNNSSESSVEFTFKINPNSGNSLAVQRLGLRTAGGAGSIPCRGTEIPWAEGQKRKKKNPDSIHISPLCCSNPRKAITSCLH